MMRAEFFILNYGMAFLDALYTVKEDLDLVSTARSAIQTEKVVPPVLISRALESKSTYRVCWCQATFSFQSISNPFFNVLIFIPIIYLRGGWLLVVMCCSTNVEYAEALAVLAPNLTQPLRPPVSVEQPQLYHTSHRPLCYTDYRPHYTPVCTFPPYLLLFLIHV